MPEIQTNNLVDHGQLKIQVTSGQRAVPIPNATIEISYTGDPDSVLETVSTDENGQTPVVDFLLLLWNTACLRVRISLILNII